MPNGSGVVNQIWASHLDDDEGSPEEGEYGEGFDQSSGGAQPWLDGASKDDGGAYKDDGVAVQAAGQLALNKQDAAACATSLQVAPENTNYSSGDPVKQDNTSNAVGSPSSGPITTAPSWAAAGSRLTHVMTALSPVRLR